MIDRLTHLLVDRQIPPDQCLAITFTDKAAKEMIDRLVRKLSSIPNITDPLVIERLPLHHSFILQGMLKKHALLIHQSPNYRILQNRTKRSVNRNYSRPETNSPMGAAGLVGYFITHGQRINSIRFY